MSRFRASKARRTSPDWTRYTVPAFAGATTASLLGATSVPLGLVAGTLAGGLLAWGTRRSGQATRLGPADIDIAFVRRALGRGRSTSEDEIRLIKGASHSVRSSVERTLQLLRSALRAQTALVLWNDAATRSVRMRGFDTSRDDLVVGHWPDGSGLLARLRAGGEPALCNDLDAGRGLLPWYPSRDGGHAIVIRLLREGVPLGYLVVDRASDAPGFDDVDLLALQTAAEQVALAIRMEMLVVEAASARREMAILDAAAARLNSALTPDDVSREAADLFARVLDIDAFIVTAFDEANAQQRVLCAQGAGVSHLVGHRFDDDGSVAARALRRMECLPYSGRIDHPDVAVLGEGMPLVGARSLLVFPMAMGQRTVGTIAVAAAREAAFDEVPRDTLSTLVRYVAAALSNALSYADMVTRATTDGMTGLTNHRTFKEFGELALARSRRSGRPLTVIITDIDHFKRVNDTYGHAVGDEVIKGVARVLADTHRDVDLAARYGGEEFALLLEDTTLDAAAYVAERLRAAVRELRFEGNGEEFSVTLSLGVAQFDGEGQSLVELVDTADQALYAAKRGGRDRVVRAGAVTEAAA